MSKLGVKKSINYLFFDFKTFFIPAFALKIKKSYAKWCCMFPPLLFTLGRIICVHATPHTSHF